MHCPVLNDRYTAQQLEDKLSFTARKVNDDL